MSDSADQELLESLQLRFAVANSIEQVQKLVSTLLVPLLDKLDVASAAIKAKIIGLLGQINKKLKGYPQVFLPIDALLESALSKDSLAYSQSFRLMYITMATERAEQEQLVLAIPLLLDGIRLRPAAQAKQFSVAFLTAVSRCTNIADEQLRGLKFSESLHRADELLQLATNVFLFNRVVQSSADRPPSVTAGLSASSQSVITNEGKAPWTSDGDILRQLKLNLGCIIGSEQAFPIDMPELTHEQRFVALLCGSNDPYFPQVASRCDDSLKRMRAANCESASFVGYIFELYLGSPPETRADSRRSPVPPALRLKLLGYLNRSATAAATFPQWLQVIFQSMFGDDTSNKLRRQGMQFLHWVIRMTPQEQISRAAPVLLQGVRKILTETTAPGGASAVDNDIIRGSAYVAWGTLTKRVAELASSDQNHLQAIFDAFDIESANVRLSIQEALLAMLPSYRVRQADEGVGGLLLALLQSQLSSSVRQARYCALRYAISAFPFACMEARWLCILGLADAERENRGLAQSGLLASPAMVTSSDENGLPELAASMRFLQARVAGTSGPAARASVTNPLVYEGIVRFGRSLLLASGMASSKRQTADRELDALDMDALSELGELTTELQRESMQTALIGLAATDGYSDSLLSAWASVVSTALTVPSLSDKTALPTSLMCLVELVSLGPTEAALAFFAQRQAFSALRSARNPVVQQRAMQVLAATYAVKLLSDAPTLSGANSELWNKQTVAYLQELAAAVSSLPEACSLDARQGSILALGYISHGLSVAHLALGKSWTDLGLEDLGLAVELSQSTLLECIKGTNKPSSHPMLVVALCVAVGQIGKTGFARNDEHSANSMARDAMVAVTEVITHTSDAKVHDAAYLALANIALGTAGLATQFIEFLQASAKTVTKKQIDVHFRIGEALATALGRFKCALVRVGWMFPIDPIAVYGSGELEANGAAIDMLLELVTSKMASSPSPQDRQAAVVWILSLVQFCPKLAQLTPWLGKLHTCLCALLTDRDEFTQEAASKTLGLVYDMGDASLKESLVYSLMSLFGGGGGSSGQGPETGGGSNTQQSVRNRIESDEPLLEQETLGQTPDGRAVNTTYKSILSLASDMQNPSLVYQFMQLASHTAIWSSRRGAAYGFATIIERARESMQPYMKAIVPKLYRYTFDPSPQTRAAMTSIWRALLGSGGLPAEGVSAARSSSVPAVSSSAEDATLPAVAVATTPGGDEWATSGTSVIEAHWEAIMDECLSSMGQREWRVRESGCSALAGAIRGANAELVVPYLEKIWQMAFRALDDIKGSVRESGLKTCQALATATVAWCTPRIPREPQRDKRAQAVLAVVVPFLVDKGVVSDAEDVRGFSLGLLLKLCKSSGSYLASSVPIIAERLLESLSSMESQAANYLTFHAESNNITQEQLEAVRLSAVKASPIMQGIELVLDQLTPESMGELVPRLQNLIRRGLGLPTRAGCARAVVMLCVKREALLRPHASALVKAISGSLTEASAVQRQAWAAAIGYMAPMLAPGMFKNLLKHLERTYIDKYESEVRGVCGQAVEQLALRCPERLREHVRGAGAMSFVLLGSWDPSEPIREAFRSAWQEYTLGSGTRLIEENLADVLALPMKYIAGDSWPRRVQSANAIADIAQTLERAGRAAAAAATARGDGAMAGAGGSLGALAELVLPELVKASQGRVWPGKGHVLECLVKVCTVNARLFAEGWLADTPRLVCDVLLKEMGRGDLAYRRVAITHFSSLVEALPLDIYAEAAAVLLDIIQHSMSGSVGGGGSSGGANAMAVDEDEPMQRPQQLMLIAAAVKALLLSLPATRLVSEDEAAQSAAVLREIALAGVWNIRVASLECLGALYRHCTAPSVPAANRLSRLLAMDTARVVEAVRACAAEGKYVAVRTAALGALEAVLGGVHGDDAWGAEASAILELLALDPIPSIADRAKEVRAGLGRRG